MMLIVGELINSTRKVVGEAIDAGNMEYIQDLAMKQVTSGVDYVDVNCGTRVNDEAIIMEQMVAKIQDVVQVPLCIDSPSSKVLDAGLQLARNGQPMVNSVSGEKERYDQVVPLVLKYKAKVIALCMDDSGLPDTAEQRVEIAEKLISDLSRDGVPLGDIYLDPLVKPISTTDSAGMGVLRAVKYLRDKHPAVHTICGLSNVSFGLPGRGVLNQTFLVQTMTMGMDAYILDPLNKSMMGLLYASSALLGQDPYCGTYLKFYRSGLYN